MKITFKSKIYVTTIKLLICVVILEVIALFLINIFEETNRDYIKNFDYEVAKIKKNQDKIYQFYKSDSFDINLGWKNPRNDNRLSQDGYRKNTYSNFKDEIITFGGSYCWGAGLNSDETIQYFLSKKLKMHFVNYCVGGYSFDQSLLKFLEVSEKKKGVKKVIIFLNENSIDGLRNLYGNFFLNSSFRVKPTFVLKGNKLEKISIPKNFKNFELNNFINFINLNKSNDLWWKRRIEKKFPFSLNLINLLHLKTLDRFKIGFNFSSNVGNLNNYESRNLLIHLINFYSTSAREREIIPYLVLIPNIRNKIDSGYKYKSLIKEVEDKNIEIKIINFSEYINLYNLKRNKKTTQEDGHYSAWTNKKIADYMIKKMQ